MMNFISTRYCFYNTDKIKNAERSGVPSGSLPILFIGTTFCDYNSHAFSSPAKGRDREGLMKNKNPSKTHHKKLMMNFKTAPYCFFNTDEIKKC